MNSDFIEAIPVPALVISREDTIAAANLPFRGLFPAMRVGRNYMTILRQPILVELVNAARSETRQLSAELAIKGQAEGAFMATVARLDGQGILICLQDMNETAVAIQIRQNFVADLGHELKTPLTAISGILETCQDDPAAMAHFLPMMSGEVGRMNSLVADLLVLSRVERNERRRPNQTLVLSELVESACAPLTILAEKTGANIHVELPSEPIVFPGDGDELIRALRNLVENAIHYGAQDGTVHIVGGVVGEPGVAPTVCLSVEDDGPGIERHHIPRLTERFYRVDSHRARSAGGSGLGLAIVKHIVNRHRGRLTIDSEPGKGTKVTLLFPQKD